MKREIEARLILWGMLIGFFLGVLAMLMIRVASPVN